jgi:hypothetical protein
MSFIGKLKDLIIIDESAGQRAPDRVDDDVGVMHAPPVATPAPTSMQTAPPITMDGSDLEKELDAQIQCDPAFAPFATFFRMSENMKSKVPNEAQRYQAVQAATETSLESLLAAVNTHSSVIKSEAANFRSSVVKAGETSIAALSQQEKQLEQQIAGLSAQLAKLTAQKDDLSRQLVTRKSSLDKLQIDFDAASETLRHRYGDYAKKLNDYLGGTANE